MLITQQMAELKQELDSANARALKQEQRASNAEQQIQRLHDEGVVRDALTKQSKESLDEHLEALKAVSAANNNVVDTRLLGKPEKFDGSNATWRDWKFTAKSYLCATNSSLKAMLDQAEVASEPIKNVELHRAGTRTVGAALLRPRIALQV